MRAISSWLLGNCRLASYAPPGSVVSASDYLRYHRMMLQHGHPGPYQERLEELLQKMTYDLLPTLDYVIKNSGLRNLPQRGKACPACSARGADLAESLMSFVGDGPSEEELEQAGMTPESHAKAIAANPEGYWKCPSCGLAEGWTEVMKQTQDEKGLWMYSDADEKLAKLRDQMLRGATFGDRSAAFEAIIQFVHGSGRAARWFIEGGTATIDAVRRLGERQACRAWLMGNCRFAQDQQLLLEFDDPSQYSQKPLEHDPMRKELEDATPPGLEVEEFADGFFHVTTNMPAVLGWGALKSRRQLGPDVPGLGGGSDPSKASPRTVSLTYSSQKAWDIYNAMMMAAKVCQGALSASQILDEVAQRMGATGDMIGEPGSSAAAVFERFGVPDEVLEGEFMEGLDEALDREVTTAREKYEFMIAIEDALHNDYESDQSENPPSRVGFTLEYGTFCKINPANIGIVAVQVRKGAPYEHVPVELEIRVSPDDVRLPPNAMVSRA